jgi:hypothetical protein
MSQNLKNKKLKGGFTKNYKSLTFRFPVERSALVNMENKTPLN